MRDRSACVTSRPTSTLPKKRKPGFAAIFSYARETLFSFGWSGATPSRTSPQGVGSRSIMSTSTETSASSSAPGAAAADVLGRRVLVHLEGVAAATGRDGVRVVDREPGLLDRIHVVHF